MISTDQFYQSLISKNITFFTGVPDSLLKDICAYITDNTSKDHHIIAANEGGAIALATGYHIATGKTPLVYMQNSGIGNAVNPLLSLADTEVYSIPMLLMIGWRGEPGVKDEPQHIKQGKVTLDLLKVMKIPYAIVPNNIESAKDIILEAISYTNEYNAPYALIVKKGTFEPYKLKNTIKAEYPMTREAAIEFVVKYLNKDDIVVSTTGMTSRELFEIRNKLDQSHENDFLTVGSMGHANQIALGIALENPIRTVYCFDGDGAVLMHTGSMGIIGDIAPKNFKHIIFNNGAHDSVGGQPTVGFKTDFCKIAKAFNYRKVFHVKSLSELDNTLQEFKETEGPALIEILVNKGARKDLGRPTTSPVKNKLALMKNLNR